MGTNHYTCEQIINAIEGTAGIKKAIAKRLGCHRHTVDYYIERYSTVRRAYEAERESIVDLAEIELVKHLKAGFWPAVRLVVITLGKDRGYTERHEVTGAEGGEITVKITGNVKPGEL